MDQLITILKKARTAKGLSQEDVGKKIGITQRAYAFYEDGTRRPKWPRLKEIGDFLGIDEKILWEAYTCKKVINDTMDDEAMGIIANGDKGAIQELSPGQVMSILTMAFKDQAEAFKAHARTMENIEKNMARAESQARVESNLQRVFGGVETIGDQQGHALKQILADLVEIKEKIDGLS